MSDPPEIAFQVNCNNSEISKDGLFEIVNKEEPGNDITKKLLNDETTIKSDFCKINEIPTDFITDDNFIKSGGFANVFNLPNFKLPDDNHEYVIRITEKKNGKYIDPKEYNGFLIQGFLATNCDYINPVKQIGIYSCGNNQIHYKVKVENIDVIETIYGFGLYGILEKGKMDLKEYINIRQKTKNKNQKTKNKNNSKFLPQININIGQKTKNKNNSEVLPNINIITALIQLLEGILCIHNNHFVHLDLKPSNIIIDMNDNIQIIDFGFATKINIECKVVKGTSGYWDDNIKIGDTVNTYNDYKAISSIILGVNTTYKDEFGNEAPLIKKGLIDITETDSDKELLKTIGKMFIKETGKFDDNDKNLINDAIKMLNASTQNKQTISKKTSDLSLKTTLNPIQIIKYINPFRGSEKNNGGRRKTQRKRRTLRKNKKPTKSKKRRKNTLRRRRRSRR